MADAREFHYRDDIYFRLQEDGSVDIFRRRKHAAYWTAEQGFHDPEEPVVTVDRDSWDTICRFTRPPISRAWIVGNGDGTQWRSWEQGMPVWVSDRSKATRYFTRADAEDAHAEDEDAWRIVPYREKHNG